MNSVYILLGSNINKEKNIRQAVILLKKMSKVTSISSVYETTPVGIADQPNFFNIVVNVATELDAGVLKKEVLDVVEKKLKRVRDNSMINAPRTIDADIILFNHEVFNYDNHHIPDPDLMKFPHIAVPMAELAPEMRHPETGVTMLAISENLLSRRDKDHASPAPVTKRPDIVLVS